jgi:hypothetical protein
MAKLAGVISGAGGGLTAGGTATGPNGGGITTGGRGGGVVQPASRAATRTREAVKLRRVESIRTDMWILILEAGAALLLLVFFVWWTMFSGRGESDQAQPGAGRENDTPER